ncbi:MAG TPA: branched-chain amino acid aminotransferase [Gammaproteobacteria bacterium]|nr:branched-chain amino acid aminotransferase [Gammaproteobacteria bacterium]
MNDDPILYINGEYVSLSTARISPLDQGFLLGDGVFDVVSAWKGVIFKLDEHIERFFDSMLAACLDPGWSIDQWKKTIVETVRKNELHDATIRFIVTRGVPKEVVADPRSFDATIIVWAAPYIFLADEDTRQKGIRLMISSTRGFPSDSLDPRYKCLDRLHSQLVRLEALSAGYDDAIWLDHTGNVSESAASNIFAVKNRVVYTPAGGILRGVTRQTFVDLALAAGYKCEEVAMTPFDLYTADEVFTTSTAGGALAVREIAGRQVRQTAPGPVTVKLNEDYWALRESGVHGTSIYD